MNNQFDRFTKGSDLIKSSKTEAVIYTRVSTKEQADNNASLDTQMKYCKKYAEEKGLNVIEYFGGTYESANGDFTRKEFKKLIDDVRKSKKRPFAILINTISRFSRTGGGGVGLASELVEGLGVHIIEVSTGKNTMTEDGKIQIYNGLLQARQENLDRLKGTIPGMEQLLEDGDWLGKAPRGYDMYGTRVKNIKFISDRQKIILNDDGKLLQKAWKWKLQGEKDFLIIQRLSIKRVKIR